jgi:putative ABC transport system permease protein
MRLWPFVWHQIGGRRGRSAAMAAGILVAAVSFSLLTAATNTQTAQVTRTVQKNLRPAYDILVLPKGTETSLERSRSLVPDNYLSGIFGGITMAQYRAIKKIPGVEIAAPIATIGYVLEPVNIPIDLTALTSAPAEVFTLTDQRVADSRLSHFPAQSLGYVYVTPDPISQPGYPPGGIGVVRTPMGNVAGDFVETLPDGSKVTVCPSSSEFPTSPFASYQGGLGSVPQCYSRANGWFGRGGIVGLPKGHIGAYISITIPLLIAAIDPAAEQELDGLGDAVVKGRYLSENQQPTPPPATFGSETLDSGPQVPVLASTAPFVDDQDVIDVDTLPASAVSVVQSRLSPDRLSAALAKEPVTRALHITISSASAYDQLLARLAGGVASGSSGIDAYWTTKGISYTTTPSGVLSPATVTNRDTVWESSFLGGWEEVPIDDSDTAFRKLTEQMGGGGTAVQRGPPPPTLKSVGEFDPAKLPGFSSLSSLSQVPMILYPPTVTGAGAASQRALGGRPLLPDANIAGYLQQPPMLLTTLSSLSAFAMEFPGGDWSAPISSIRVRVGGVQGTVKQELAEIAGVAAAIRKATGLQVDITAGSSPTAETVALPAGKYGRPALLLHEDWVKEAVALVIISALDRKSLVLFALILLVTALFLVNGSIAAVRARRPEIGVLRCLGWRRGGIFRLILGELLFLGALAGLLGTGICVAMIAGFHLDLPLLRVLLIMPVAVILAGVAGLVPAWLATRGQPLDAVRPAVIAPRRARPVRRLVGLAWSNLRRRPARAALAAVALGVGIAALTLLLGIDLAFSQVAQGTLLGNFVNVEVRGVDYLSAGLAVLLGAASVADVLYLNVRERAPELAALAATGWRRRHLTRIALFEGAGIGMLGSVAGAIVGLVVTALLGGSVLGLLAAAVIAVAGGLGITLGSSWIVTTAVSRQPIAAAVAEE